MSSTNRLDVASPAQTVAHFINGELLPPANGQYYENLNPATNQVIARVPQGDKADVDRAVAAAQDAHAMWKSTGVEQRASLLERVADLLEGRAVELASLESRDTGKPVRLARRLDIARSIANFRFFAGALYHDTTQSHSLANHLLNFTRRRPVGQVAAITPWNLPLMLLCWKVAPALAMGNTVVAKPSEFAPLTAAALSEIFQEADAPPGIINIVFGSGEAGQALVEHDDIRGVSFTGGTATGRRIASTAAPTFKKVSLELSGKNPTIVCGDADFDKAVEGTITAGFTNQGQVCTCGSRVFVEQTIFDKFVDALVDKVGSLQIGDPADEATDLGSLIHLQHREKVENYLDLLKAGPDSERGEILIGGKRPELPPPLNEGAFLEPTIVTNISPVAAPQPKRSLVP